MQSKHVVLVDEEDKFLGVAMKQDVHNDNTPLHRGVSVFLLNRNNQLLIQKRHKQKKTWGGFWSNSFCGHPQIDETYEQAIARHAKFELGINVEKLFFISKYRYQFQHNNVFENEICPIYLAISNDDILMNNDEVQEVKWIEFLDFKKYLAENADVFTPWCKEEFEIIEKSDIMSRLGV